LRSDAVPFHGHVRAVTDERAPTEPGSRAFGYALSMTAPRLASAAELDAAFAAERFLLFKHSTRCPISAAAFAEYRAFTAAHPEAASGWIDVIEDRALARTVAERTGIQHESPQAILLARGAPVWNASHSAIRATSLESALAAAGSARRGQ
jgi:bacillithiol system protein YtxJ